MVENNNVQPEQDFTDDKMTEVEFALKIARRAVERANVPDISTYEPPPFKGMWVCKKRSLEHFRIQLAIGSKERVKK